MCPQCILNLKYKGQIQRRLRHKHLVFAQFQHPAQAIDNSRIQGPRHFQADRAQFAALADDLLHMFPVIQILIVDTVRVDIGVSGDPDQGFFLYPVFIKYHREKMQDQLLCQHIVAASAWHRNQTVKYAAGAWNDSDFRFIAAGFQHCHGIDFTVLKKWEWLLLSDDDRREEWFDFLFKIAFQLFLFDIV